MHRSTTIIGNWKMNKLIAEARSFVSGLALTILPSHAYVGLAVPFTMITAAAEAARGTAIAIGAQNVSEREGGAFTGEVSCLMVKDAGGSFVLVGHSERRQLFHETDALVNKKTKRALADGLKPVVCIGETLEQHEAGKTDEVLRGQLTNSLKDLTADEVERLIIAYEPVWAIGTGKTATANAAQSAHAFCRDLLKENWGKSAAERVVIQYGGSVKPDNAKDLLDQTDVDGLLVGGASLSLDSFAKIVQAAI